MATKIHDPAQLDLDAPPGHPIGDPDFGQAWSGETVDLTQVPRELGRVVGCEPGPTLICLGGLHGNEPAGVLAIARVLAELQRDSGGLRGELIGLAGNRRALASGCRFLHHDLNRAWRPERLTRLLSASGPLDGEDQEQRELDVTLQRIIDQAPERVYLLDLHTTSGPGPAFAILDDTLPNREVALDFPVPLVLGLEEELAGTLARYLTAQGVTVVGFEAGSHQDPFSVNRSVAAIWIALESCGLIEAHHRPEVDASRELLHTQPHNGAGRIVEVRHRHHIQARDGFVMEPGFRSFQPIILGQPLAVSNGVTITAPKHGLLLMPLYQDQGQDGFFVVREIRPMWLSVSRVIRGMHLERVLHWLPGVRRHPDRPEAFIVDRRYARWLAPQLFHLLGFRRRGKAGRILTMTRRRDRAT